MFGKLGRFIQRKKEIMTCYTVIIMSDDPETSTHVRHTLEAARYTVFSASTVAEVLPLLDTMLPDLLICDFAQPELTGRAFLDTIRIRLGKSMMPRILFLRDDPDDERVANIFGADDILLKPLNPEVLLTCVARLTHLQPQVVAASVAVASQRV
jgi:two-component system phosphate regulon response regulator PhoB